MKPNIYLIAVVVIGIIIYIVLRKKNVIKKQEEPMNHDLIVTFKEHSYVDIRKRKEFTQIAKWLEYGHYGFRGFSTLTKDELEDYIMQELKITRNDFKVINAFLDLYIPS